MGDDLGNFDRIEEMFFIKQALGKSDFEFVQDKKYAIGKMTTFEEYTKDRKLERDEEQDEQEENKSGLYVILLIMPDGQTANLVVNSNAEEIACEFKDAEGVVQKVELSPLAKKEIFESIYNGQNPAQVQSALTPNTLEDLQRTITEENIDLDKEPEQEVDKKKVNDAPEEVQDFDEHEEDEEKNIEKDKIEEEVPDDVKDAVEEFYAREGKVQGSIRVRKVSAKDMSERMRKSEINPNDPDMYLFEIPGGRSGKVDSTRMVLVSPNGMVYDEEQYDEALSGYMREHGIENAGLNSTSPQKGRNDYIAYTDLEGNVTIQEIQKTPDDLTSEEKDAFQLEFEKLDNAQTIIIQSDMPPEQKGEELLKINASIENLFERYGMKMPSSIQEEFDHDVQDVDTMVEQEDESEVPEQSTDDENEHYPDDHSGGRLPPWMQGHRLF